jgi:hypothetical protein
MFAPHDILRTVETEDFASDDNSSKLLPNYMPFAHIFWPILEQHESSVP